MDPVESKAAKFKRLAEARTETIIDEIRKLSNLSDTNTYTYTEQQLAKIFGTLTDRLETARMRFLATLKFRHGAEQKFEL